MNGLGFLEIIQLMLLEIMEIKEFLQQIIFLDQDMDLFLGLIHQEVFGYLVELVFLIINHLLVYFSKIKLNIFLFY